jgi:hypothetical protein
MDNATLMYIVIGLLFIFFVVMLVFSAKSWRVLHIITAFLVFAAAGALVFLTAATLRTHQEWRSAYNALTRKVEQRELDKQKLLVGVQGEADETAVSIREAEAELQRVIMDRGRVWRGVLPDVAADNITLTINTTPAAPPAEGEEGAEAPPAEEPPAEEPPAEGEEGAEGEVPPPAPAGRHSIEQDTIIYAFLEGESTLTGALQGTPPFMVPTLYLGEFRVVNRTDTTITVQPTVPLTALQQASLGEGSWTIYDNMPVDAQYVFDGLTEEDLRTLFPQERMTISDAQYNARIAQIAQFFPGKTPVDIATMIPKNEVLLSGEGYEQLIQQYLNSGKEVNADDYPVESIWKEVKMLVPVNIQVDAVLRDVKGSTYNQDYEITAATAVKRQEGEVVIGETALVTAKPGDTDLGQARLALTITEALKRVSDYDIVELWDAEREPAILKALTELQPKDLEAVLEAKSVSLDIGDTAVLHPETAKFLIDNQLAEEVKSIYIRPLRDYAHYFNDSHRQELLFEDSARVTKQDTETLLAANAKALEQVTYRDDEIMKLQADRAGFQREAAAMTAVAQQAEARSAAVRARLSELYKSNLQLAETIKTLQLRWAAAGREAPATPSTPAPVPEAVSAP